VPDRLVGWRNDHWIDKITVMNRTLIQDLDALHATYVVAVNEAVEADDLARAEALALAYEDDAIQLMAEREGLTHLLPLQRRRPADSRLRRIVRLLAPRAA
jgi:hypothetical protein